MHRHLHVTESEEEVDVACIQIFLVSATIDDGDAMLFFRSRDTSRQPDLTDPERCIHACLFSVFVLLVITIVLFYFAATTKSSDDQRLYYYVGAGVSLALLLLVTFLTIAFIRRLYSEPDVSSRHQGLPGELEPSTARYATRRV